MTGSFQLTMVVIMVALFAAGMLVLGGCATLHERLCEATVTHYEKVPHASEAEVYFGHYTGVCYEETVRSVDTVR